MAGQPASRRSPVARAFPLAGVWLAACALAAAGIAAGPARAHLSHGKVIRGVVTYQRFCASCHGATGLGDGPRAADALAPPVDLTAIAERHAGFDRRAVADWIAGSPSHAGAASGAWREASLLVSESGELPRPLDELLEYLEHLQR